MNILFIISELILLTAYILNKKSEEKLDLFNSISIGFVLLFVYNTIICLILSVFKVKIELFILCIINLIIACILFSMKKFQQFKINKTDFIYNILMIIIILVITFINLGFPFNIKYETGDSAVHFLTSKIFSEEGWLMPEADSTSLYGKMMGRKPLSYVNSGLAMMCIKESNSILNYYNIYVCFDILVILLTWSLTYSTMKRYTSSSKDTIIAFIFSTFCTLGYPLNCMLFGFEYQSMGLLLFISIINTMYHYNKEDISRKLIITIMSLLTFGLFFSYYTYAVHTYIAIFLYMIYINFTKCKKLISLDLIENIIFIIIVPSILGYIYHMNFDIYLKFFNLSVINKILIILCIPLIKILIHTYKRINNEIIIKISKNLIIILCILAIGIILYKMKSLFNTTYGYFLLNSGLKKDGYIYMNFYSNIILLLPLLVYLFIINYDNKKIKENLFEWLLFLINLFLIIILTCAYKKQLISIYYVMKFYYTLWIIVMILSFKAIININNLNKKISIIILCSYIIMVILSVIISNYKMEYLEYNDYEKITSVGEIYKANIDLILKKKNILTREKIELILESKKLDYSKNIEYITSETEYTWIYTLNRYINIQQLLQLNINGQEYLAEKNYNIKNFINNVDYILYFKDDDNYYLIKNLDSNNYKIIYSNNSGAIIEIMKNK